MARAKRKGRLEIAAALRAAHTRAEIDIDIQSTHRETQREGERESESAEKRRVLRLKVSLAQVEGIDGAPRSHHVDPK